MTYLSAPPLSVSGLNVAGIMTGTSCDGMDVACLRFDGTANAMTWRTLWSTSAAYPKALRERVLRAQQPGSRRELAAWLELNRDLGRWYAQAMRKVLARQKVAPHLLANHGQTLAHHPDSGLTLQMGDPSILSQATGLTVASSFREGDVAANGQGAPLAPRFHFHLACELGAPKQAVAIHNLGGISNLSYFGRGRILAFDTGPGNAWIDAAAVAATRGRLQMDVDGKLASQGKADSAAVREILRHPYFKKAAPKSTGRDDFPFEMLKARTRAKSADLVATATMITVESIARAYESAILRPGHGLDAIHFCGGGAKNPTLLQGVRTRLPGVAVHALVGHDPQTVEAEAFALFGCLALLGAPIGGPWTGARGFGPPAHLIPGENWSRLLSKVRETRSPR